MRQQRRIPGIYRRGSTYTVHVHWTDASGKQRQHKRGGFATLAEAERYRNQYKTQIHSGQRLGTTTLRLEDYLTREWLPSKADGLKPSSYASYEAIIQTHIIPHLGNARLEELTARRVEALYRDLRAGTATGRPLSPKTIAGVAGVLKSALKDAVRWGLLAVNPIAEAKRPPGKSPEMQAWEPDELRAFIQASSQDRQAAIWHLAATTGLRRGEILGLRWSDIDLDNGRMTVRNTRVRAGNEIVEGSPKTNKGLRTISLDPQTADALKKLKARQAEDRLAHGEIWQNDNDYVAIEEDGRPSSPLTMSRRFQRIVAEANLPRIRFHDLRHSYVVAARRAGIDTKVISERIGHADITVTLRVYDHVFRDDDTEAARRIADAIYSQQPRAGRG